MDAARRTLEQRTADLCLELLDTLTERGLRQKKRVRRFDEAALVGDRN